MSTSCQPLAVPLMDRRTREARSLAAQRVELQRRLGPSPSFEARQIAEQILRTSLDIWLIQRKRHERGELGSRDHELLMRRENALARLLERLERLAPPPDEPSLAEQLRAERQAAAV